MDEWYCMMYCEQVCEELETMVRDAEGPYAPFDFDNCMKQCMESEGCKRRAAVT